MDWSSGEVVVLDKLSGGYMDEIVLPAYRCPKGSGQLCIPIAILVFPGNYCLWRRHLSLFILRCLWPFAPLLVELRFRGLAAFFSV